MEVTVKIKFLWVFLNRTEEEKMSENYLKIMLILDREDEQRKPSTSEKPRRKSKKRKMEVTVKMKN